VGCCLGAVIIGCVVYGIQLGWGCVVSGLVYLGAVIIGCVGYGIQLG